MKKTNLTVERGSVQQLGQHQVEDPFRAPPAVTPKNSQEEEDVSFDQREDSAKNFTMRQLISFVVLVIFSVGSVLLWKFHVFGETAFPWFIDIIGTFLCAWALHYWLSRFWLETSEEKKRKQLFGLHCSLWVTVNGVFYLTWLTYSPRGTYWFMYPLAITAVLLAIHFTWTWTPDTWRWIVCQLFVYFIVIAADFVIWFIDPVTGPWWIYIAAIYGAILVLQVGIYFLVTWLNRQIPLSPPIGVAANEATKYTKLLTPMPGTSGYNTYPARKTTLQKRGVTRRFHSWSPITAPKRSHNQVEVLRKDLVPSDESYDAGVSSDGGGEVIVIDPESFSESKAISSSTTGNLHVIGEMETDDEEENTNEIVMVVNSKTSSIPVSARPSSNQPDQQMATSVGSPIYHVEVFE